MLAEQQQMYWTFTGLLQYDVAQDEEKQRSLNKK